MSDQPKPGYVVALTEGESWSGVRDATAPEASEPLTEARVREIAREEMADQRQSAGKLATCDLLKQAAALSRDRLP